MIANEDSHDARRWCWRGPVRELNELRAGSAASLAELREFLAKLKGRKPQEVIGIVSASLLVQSMVMAFAAVVGLLVLFTLGPYLIYGPPNRRRQMRQMRLAVPATQDYQTLHRSHRRPGILPTPSLHPCRIASLHQRT